MRKVFDSASEAAWAALGLLLVPLLMFGIYREWGLALAKALVHATLPDTALEHAVVFALALVLDFLLVFRVLVPAMEKSESVLDEYELVIGVVLFPFLIVLPTIVIVALAQPLLGS